MVTETGEQLGAMSVPEAINLARDRGLDLVEVAPNATPPVCRVLDYGKLRYLYSKKEREAKKAQKSTALREVRLRTRIGDHDFKSKIRKVKELIGTGSKVKVAVVFRGREVTHREIGVALLKRVTEEVQSEARLEGPPSMEGRSLSMMLVPGARKLDKPAPEAKPMVTDSAVEAMVEVAPQTDGQAAPEAVPEAVAVAVAAPEPAAAEKTPVTAGAKPKAAASEAKPKAAASKAKPKAAASEAKPKAAASEAKPKAAASKAKPKAAASEAKPKAAASEAKPRARVKVTAGAQDAKAKDS